MNAVELAHARMQTLAKLILGHAVEFAGGDNTHMRFRVGEHLFEDERTEYPSVNLLANLTLAVDAEGYPRSAFDIPDFDTRTMREAIYYGRYRPNMAATLCGERIT